MQAFCRAFLAFAIVFSWLGKDCLADPWIAGVTPRLVSRGTTSEIVVAPWRHEALAVVFYPQTVVGSEFAPASATGIRCAGTHFDAAKERLVCRLEIAADCTPGEYSFRVLTALGLSSLGTVYVGAFPLVDEDEVQLNSNDTPETALPVPADVTVRGALSKSSADDVDCFRVAGKAGERLSVEVDMVKMGDDLQWQPFPESYDSVVTILDPTGKKIAANDDSALNRQDPLISVKLPVDGDYTIVLRRAMYMAHERAYAIHIGRFFRPLAAFPSGGPAGMPLEVQLLGDPVCTETQTITVPKGVGSFPHFAAVTSPLYLRSSPFPNVLEASGQFETRVPTIPIAVNGILAAPDELDRFRLTVKKGEPLQVRVWASGLGSPVDPSIRLRPVTPAGSVGPVELEADDATLVDRDIFGGHGDFPETFDPSVIWTPQQDGDYHLEITDPRGVGGPTHVYRVEIAPPNNTLHIGLTWENYKPERPRKTSLSVPRGSRWTVRLSLYPGQGSNINGPLELGVDGLPPGVSMLSPRLPNLQPVWPMTFIADANAPIDASLFRITARPLGAGAPFVTFNQQNLQRVSYSHYPWRNVRLDHFAASVSEPAGFALEIEAPKQPLMRGSEMKIPVRIARQPGNDEPLEIQCEFAPPGVGTSPAEVIPAGESSATLTLSAEANAKLGSSPLYVIATTMQPRGGRQDGSVKGDTARGDERVRVSSEVITLEVAEPFVSFATEPQSIRRGERLAYRWTVKQVRPFEGKASVRMLGLPVGMNAVGPEPTIDKNSTEVVVELEARDEALLGLVNDLKCEVRFSFDGQEIGLRTGSGKLRIDPRREP